MPSLSVENSNFFRENKAWNSMENVKADNSHEMPSFILSEKKREEKKTTKNT